MGDLVNDAFLINPNPNPIAAEVLNDNRSFWHDHSINKRILALNRRLSNLPLHSNELRPWTLTCTWCSIKRLSLDFFLKKKIKKEEEEYDIRHVHNWSHVLTTHDNKYSLPSHWSDAIVLYQLVFLDHNLINNTMYGCGEEMRYL